MTEIDFDRCAGCPRIIRIIAAIERLNILEDELIKDAVSDDSELAAVAFAALSEDDGFELLFEEEEEDEFDLVDSYRNHVESRRATVRARIAALTETAMELKKGCTSGPHTTDTLTPRDIVKLTICGSANAQVDGTRVEPAVVDRSKREWRKT